MLMILFCIYQADMNLLLQKQEFLKYHADEAANTASLHFDEEKYADGLKVFNDSEANAALRDIVKANLKLNDDLSPLDNTYWVDNLSYTAYYYDDSLIKREYRDGMLISETDFSYGEMFTDPKTGHSKLISEPTVIVTLNAGQPRVRLEFLQGKVTVSQTSAYEYLGY